MTNTIFTSFILLSMLFPFCAIGQTNADILRAAEDGLKKNCMAFAKRDSAPKGRNCFTSEVGKDNDGWYRVYKPPVDGAAKTIWWIGDSRTVGMSNNGVINPANNEAVLAKVSMGHTWLVNTALPKLKTCISDGDAVILALGANDIDWYSKYIKTYGNLRDKYKRVDFYVVSVNPVVDSKTKYLDNDAIVTFNENMKQAFQDIYIDTYSKVEGMVTPDCTDNAGLHYHAICNIEKTVYQTVMDTIGQ